MTLAESFLKACDAASHDGYAAAYYQKLRPMLAAVSEVVKACEDNVGGWLSASLEDPMVCAEMKADVNKWFAALTRLREVIEGQGGGE